MVSSGPGVHLRNTYLRHVISKDPAESDEEDKRENEKNDPAVNDNV